MTFACKLRPCSSELCRQYCRCWIIFGSMSVISVTKKLKILTLVNVKASHGQIDVQVQLFYAFGLFDHPIFFCTLHSSAPYLLLHLKRFSTGKTFALGLWVGCASWAAFVTVYTVAKLQTAKMAITYWYIGTYHAVRLSSTLSYQETDLCCITAFAGSYNYH